MCVACAEMRPWSLDETGSDCAFAALVPPESERGDGGARGFWSLDRIADQLTTGYWGVSTARAFATGSDGTLTFDLAGLRAEGRAVARAALEEWSLVTGIAFEEAEDEWRPATTARERGDAAASVRTGAAAPIGGAFEGGIDRAGDRDWIEVAFEPWQLATIRLVGSGGLGAPRAALRDAAGAEIAFDWRTDGRAREVTVFAQEEPVRIFVEAAGRGDATGGYRLELREPSEGAAADIAFGDDRSGAFAYFHNRGTEIVSATVNVASSWIASFGTAAGTYGFQTYLHEIGHALGLGHAGDYNGDGSYARDALYANDSWQSSVMSYFDQGENTAVEATPAFVVTPMVADIIAVRELYGDRPVRAGDTVYGEGSTAGGALDLVAASSRPLAFAIVDTGGRDRLDLRSQRDDQDVDLRPESVSDVFGHRGTMTIARGTMIEDARLGSGDDDVTGNGARNRIWGAAGDDRIDGGAGGDRLRGGSGADRLDGDAGTDDVRGNSGDDRLSGGGARDRVKGGSGDDRLAGGAGDDRLVGGRGDDTLWGGDASWAEFTDARGSGDRDALRGGAGADRLIGGSGRDDLRGGDGDDDLSGGGGRDRLDGGAGDDVLRGGRGADVFVFARSFGADRIEDFAASWNRERIDLSRVDGVGSFDDLSERHMRAHDDGVTIDAGSAGRILLAGVSLGDLDAADFIL